MQNNMDVVEIMASIEDGLIELYLGFSEKFPEDSRFWQEIAEDEKAQASIIRSFSDLLGAKEVRQLPATFKRGSLEYTMEFLNKLLSKGPDAPDDAFEIAEWLERSLIDNNVLMENVRDAPDSMKIFKLLERKKQRNMEMIEEYRKQKRAF